DGKLVVYEQLEKDGQKNIFALPLNGGEPLPLAATKFDERHPAVSPSGHWLAYLSNDTGAYQVYVQTFPYPGGKKTHFNRWCLRAALSWRGEGVVLQHAGQCANGGGDPKRGCRTDCRNAEGSFPTQIRAARLHESFLEHASRRPTLHGPAP